MEKNRIVSLERKHASFQNFYRIHAFWNKTSYYIYDVESRAGYPESGHSATFWNFSIYILLLDVKILSDLAWRRPTRHFKAEDPCFSVKIFLKVQELIPNSYSAFKTFVKLDFYTSCVAMHEFSAILWRCCWYWVFLICKIWVSSSIKMNCSYFQHLWSI